MALMACLPPAYALVPEPAPCHGPPSGIFDSAEMASPEVHDRGYDVLSYDLDLVLDPLPPQIKGSINIGLQAISPQLEIIHLDLVSNLVCLEVESGGNSLFFEHTGDSLLVHLAHPLAIAEIETLTVAWGGRPLPHGSFRAGLMFRLHHAGTLTDPSDDMPAIASVSETWSAHSWWPCKDHPADKAMVSLAATVPDTLSLVSNGILLAVEHTQPGWTTYRWSENYPLPTYLVSVAASNYATWSDDCTVSSAYGPDQTIPLGFHVFPHDQPDGLLDLAVTCEAMQFMTDLAGPYPYDGEKYDQVEIKWAGSMEHPTATSLSMIFFTGDSRFETLLVHELAHQWYGNSLTPAAWEDIWLNEGFARYCEALWVEERQGRQAYLDFMNLIGPDHYPDLFAGQGLLGDPDPILPNLLVYDKGAWLLHSLRLLLGDQTFFELLTTYANDTQLKHGSVTSADFVRLTEEAAGRNLTHFFDPWLLTESVVTLHANVDIEPRGESGAVNFDFQQLQEVWMETAIPVTVHCPAGDTRTVLVMTQRTQQFSLNFDCPVDSVTVDPEKTVMMRQATAGALYLDVIGPWPNPFPVEGADFRIYLLEDADVSLSIYDARGRMVHKGGPGMLNSTGPANEEGNTPHIWYWSPLSEKGMAAGVYWFEFKAAGYRCVKKTTFIR